jgi:hypothetical protein
MDSLAELVDVLAADPSTAAPRLRGILSLCSPLPSAKVTTMPGVAKSSAPLVTVRRLDSILALARFLAASGGQFRQQLLPYLLSFLKVLLVPPTSESNVASALSVRSPFFPQLLKPLFELARSDIECQKSISGSVAEILHEVTQATRVGQGEEPLPPVVHEFLIALGEGALPLLGGDADNVAKWLFECWIGASQGLSSTAPGLHLLKANGHSSPGEHGKQANGGGEADAQSLRSRSPSAASLSESGDDSISDMHSRGGRSSDSSGVGLDEPPPILERRKWAFRIFAQLLPQARAQGGPKDVQLLGAYRERASKQLKAIFLTLQVSRAGCTTMMTVLSLSELVLMRLPWLTFGKEERAFYKALRQV